MHVCQINGHMAVMIRRQYSANCTWSWLVILQPRCFDRNSTIEQTLFFCCNRFIPIPTGLASPSTLEAESNAVASRMWSREMIMSTVFYPYPISTCYHQRMRDIAFCHVTADSREWILLHDLTFYTRYSAAVTHEVGNIQPHKAEKKWLINALWDDMTWTVEKKRSEQ